MESYVSLGMALPLAVERVDFSLGIRNEPTLEQKVDAAVNPVPSPAENDAALAQLNAMLGGVSVR